MWDKEGTRRKTKTRDVQGSGTRRLAMISIGKSTTFHKERKRRRDGRIEWISDYDWEFAEIWEITVNMEEERVK